MALQFTNDGDRVNHGSGSTLDNLVPITAMAWVYPTTVDTQYRRIFIKRVDGSNEWQVSLSDEFNSSVLNNFQYVRRYSTTGAFARSAADTVTLNEWQLLVATFDGTNAPKLYRGTNTSAPTECSYHAQNAPVGTNCNDDTADLVVGYRLGASNTQVIGSIAWVGMWNRALTLNEIIAQWHSVQPTANCVLFRHYFGTGTQYDWSGNANDGTVTGATAADHAPIRVWHIPQTWRAEPSGAAQALSATVAAVSAVAGSLAVARALSATSAAVSSAAGAMAVARALSAATAGASGATGSLAVARALAGTTGGVSTAAGTLAVLRALAAQSAAVSTVAGALDVSSLTLLAAVVAASSSVSGSLQVARSLSATVSAQSGAAGALARSVALSGGVAGQSSAAGRVAVARALAGTIAGQSAVLAALNVVLLTLSLERTFVVGAENRTVTIAADNRTFTVPRVA